MISAGDLRHRVSIEQLGVSLSQSGEQTESWVTHVECWAEVTPLSGRELIAASATQSEVTTRMRIRYRDDIAPNMRVVYRGRIFGVEAVQPDRESGLEYLTLLCTSGVADR